MMKSVLTILIALALAGTASADVVNFGLLGTNTPDITGVGYPLDNVIFTYDTGLIPDPALGSAVLTQFGVDITPGDLGATGTLVMQLPGPMLGGFSFDFSIISNGSPLGDLMFLDLVHTGFPGIYSIFGTANASGNGSVASPFGAAGLYDLANVSPNLDQGAADLRISNVSYDAVPEPGTYTYALLTAGLLLLGFGRRPLAGRKS